MSFSYLSVISLVLILWLIKKLVQSSSTNRQNAPYPPGPKPKPLIGNALDFPTSNAHEVYVEWGKKYQSAFVFGSALGNNILILNKFEDADELLERRAGIYSDRPVIPIVKLLGWDYNIALLPYGKSWRFHRQISQQNFRAEAARGYYPLLLRKVHEMLSRLLTNPEKFEEHHKMLSISAPMITMYGYKVESFEDPCIVAADESITAGTPFILPGGTWLNTIPALAKINVPLWFPGATTWKIAARVRGLSEEMERIPFEFARKTFAEGTAVDSFVSKFLKKKDEVGASEEEELAVRNIAATVYGAASDTTVATTKTLFYLLAVHPEVQRKAQAEIDRVIGSGRLPEFEDRPSLPYIEAIYREVLRYAPPLPLGIPHRLMEDDYYKGYLIPKGTVVFSNVWAMAHDEDVYPEPHKFKPERFFDENGKLDDNNRILAYGFGRRVCVGKYLASATVWITIASVLACFDIEKSKDESGNDIEISDDYDDFGALRHKSKYQCSFVPRSLTARHLIINNTSRTN